MTDLLEDLEAYLLSTLNGTVCYRDTMLEGSDTAVALYEYAGQSMAPQIAGAIRSVQIQTRSKSSTVAKELARKLYAALDTEDGILDLTVDRWCYIQLQQVPFKLKIDDKDRTYYCFNIRFVTYYD